MSDLDRVETCSCGKIAKRVIADRGWFYGEKVEDAEYCPVVGQVVRSSAHRRQIARDRGWEEVGNDCPDRWHREIDEERARNSDYQSLMRGLG